jgi:hypothetical protein
VQLFRSAAVSAFHAPQPEFIPCMQAHAVAIDSFAHLPCKSPTVSCGSIQTSTGSPKSSVWCDSSINAECETHTCSMPPALAASISSRALSCPLAAPFSSPDASRGWLAAAPRATSWQRASTSRSSFGIGSMRMFQ